MARHNRDGAADRRQATLQDVADRSGVSVSTASRALNGVTTAASTATIDRVLAAARELHYVPNAQAVGLRRKTSKVVGLIVADIMNPFFAAIAVALEQSLLERGYGLLVANTGNSTEMERRYVKTMAEKRVEALVVAPTSDTSEHLSSLQRLGIRLILIDSKVSGIDVDCVLVDDHHAINRATRHLIELGHHDIGYISGHQRILSDQDRLGGYRQALEDAGLQYRPELVVRGDFTQRGGYQAAAMLWSSAHPTAIVSGNNFMTIGVLRWAKAAGVDIPGQLSLVSFDDMDSFDLVSPSVTAVQQPVAEVGALVSELVTGDHTAPVPYVLPTRMVVRESTARPGSGTDT